MAIRVAHPTSSRRAEPVSDVAAFVRHLDYLLLAAVGGLIAYGLWVLSAVSRNDIPGDPNYYVLRQTVNIALGVAALLVVTAISPDLYRRSRRAIYTALLVLLGVVLAMGPIRGSARWIDLGFFRLQPSEIGKVLLIFCLAAFLSERSRVIADWRTTIGALGLAAIPTVLVFAEPDFGTALVYAAVLTAALFLAGTHWLHLAVLALLAVGLALGILWFLPAAGVDVLKPYQLDRLVGFLHPSSDPSGSTYNVTQSITAVGSGGLDGRGIAGASQTNLNYLPEHETDFIFSSLAEQRGFLGAALLLVLYVLVVWRGLKIVSIARDLFSAVVAGTVVAAFLLQVFINVGMTIGIAPITGIPLPFVSYGGSSMITTLVMIGLLEAIHVRGRLAEDRHR